MTSRTLIMVIKIRLNNDKKGIGTITVAAIVAVIIIVAACAVILINNNSDAKTFAPGTTFSYDVNGTYTYSEYEFILTGTIDQELVSQNDKEYFFDDKMVIDIKYNTETTNLIDQETVDMVEKSNMVSSDAVKIGTCTLDTIDGNKTVVIWQETDSESGSVETDYVGSDNNVLYKSTIEITDGSNTIELTAILSDSDLKWQTSYKESSSIGVTYNYDITGEVIDHSDSNVTGTCTLECVGEGSQYCFQADTEIEITISGQSNSETDTSYTLSDSISGLSDSAVLTGTTNMQTIDGYLTLNIWTDSDTDEEDTCYVSQDGNVIYLESALLSLDYYDLNIEMTLTSRS